MKSIVLAVGWAIIAAWFGVPQETAPGNFKNTQEIIDFLSREAVKDAETQSHVHLGYSVESIQRVESVLGDLHAQYVKNPSSIAVKGLASAYGAYIGEVIRKAEKNVSWETSDSVGGEKSCPLIWSGVHAYPIAWCYRRIMEGDEDNVWVKYQALKEQASRSVLTLKK